MRYDIYIYIYVSLGAKGLIDENCALQSYCAASSGFLTLEDWTDRLSRNVGKILPLLPA